MAGGRIDSERLGLALERVGQSSRVPATDIKPPTSQPTDSQPAPPRDFGTAIETADRSTAEATRSPRQCIADFVMPTMTDPTLLQSSRSVSILEHLASEILPNLDAGDDLRSLAGAIIADEIARRRDFLMRLHGGIPA